MRLSVTFFLKSIFYSEFGVFDSNYLFEAEFKSIVISITAQSYKHFYTLNKGMWPVL